MDYVFGIFFLIIILCLDIIHMYFRYVRGNEHLDQYRHLRHQMLSHSGLKHKYMSDSWLVNVLEVELWKEE